MLSKFCVEGFKCFQRKIELNLGNVEDYEFNTEVIKNRIVNKGLIYGFNGCGKSNLGYAIFDIVTHLTDKQSAVERVKPYLNMEMDVDYATFEYHFFFDNKELVYLYKKSSPTTLKFESLLINGKEVLQYDFDLNDGFVTLAGTKTLNLKPSIENNISRIKYVRSNAILDDTEENKVFNDFINFVDKMLLFYSLDRNSYIGFKIGSESISAYIVETGKTKEFESFLNKFNVNVKLSEKEIDGEKKLMVHYKNSDVSFYSVASSGTKSLALFFYWFTQMEEASFVFMDEFDAFYHFELAKEIVKLLLPLKKVQILFTTHNTDLLSNDLLRPDCYFLMEDNRITALSNLTEKDIRKAHNLQKMFKAGAFNV